jgi:hypothetical protein
MLGPIFIHWDGNFETCHLLLYNIMSLLYDSLLLFVQRIGMLALFNLGIKTLDLSFGSSLFRRYAEARPPVSLNRDTSMSLL